MFRVWEPFPNYTGGKKKKERWEERRWNRAKLGPSPKNILWVFKLDLPPPSSSSVLPPPHPLFKATTLCEDPLGGLWHLKECDARVCVRACVCVRVCVRGHTHTCLYAAQIAGGRAELPSHVGCCLGVQRLGPGARFTPNTTCQAKWNSHYF